MSFLSLRRLKMITSVFVSRFYFSNLKTSKRLNYYNKEEIVS